EPRPAPAAATPGAGRTLATGTRIVARTTEEINSRKNKAGETISVTVSDDVEDARGQVVIPAGATIDLTITEIQPAENRGQKDGRITLTPTAVRVGGQSYPIVATIDSVERHLKGRGVTAGDVAKVGGGAAAGAIAGRVLGGKGKGTIIGGVIGAAAGTAVAVETADRDVVVPPGAAVVLRLSETFTTRAR
ncbi:MAG TPA: hypothetical protein VNK43_08145, partial [Gemmatimonadales bacterium]|nr:hypothetical protein [Gemmatimonadales bacterium]